MVSSARQRPPPLLPPLVLGVPPGGAPLGLGGSLGGSLGWSRIPRGGGESPPGFPSPARGSLENSSQEILDLAGGGGAALGGGPAGRKKGGRGLGHTWAHLDTPRSPSPRTDHWCPATGHPQDTTGHTLDSPRHPLVTPGHPCPGLTTDVRPLDTPRTLPGLPQTPPWSLLATLVTPGHTLATPGHPW